MRRRIGIVRQCSGAGDGANRRGIELELVIAGCAKNYGGAASVSGADDREVRGVAQQDRRNLIEIGVARIPERDGFGGRGLTDLHLAEVDLRLDVSDFAERLIARVDDINVRFSAEGERHGIVEKGLIAGAAVSGITRLASSCKGGDSGILLRTAVNQDGAVAGSVCYINVACGIDCQITRILQRSAERRAGCCIRGGAVAYEIVNSSAGIDGVDAVSAAIGDVENSIVVDDQSAGLNKLGAGGGYAVRIGDWSCARENNLLAAGEYFNNGVGRACLRNIEIVEIIKCERLGCPGPENIGGEERTSN